jgi:hypothetical protein
VIGRGRHGRTSLFRQRTEGHGFFAVGVECHSAQTPHLAATVRTRYRIIIMGLPIGSIQFEGPLMSQDDDFLHIKNQVWNDAIGASNVGEINNVLRSIDDCLAENRSTIIYLPDEISIKYKIDGRHDLQRAIEDVNTVRRELGLEETTY